MKYQSFRGTINSGDILAWTHRKVGSWYDLKIMMVRLFQMSEYVHVGVAIVMGGRVWVLEAVSSGVRLVPLSNLLPCYILSSHKLTDERIEDGLSFVGKKEIVYSQLEAIRGFLGINNPRDNNIQCAELVNYLCDFDCGATPSEIVQHLLRNNSSMIELV